MVAPKTIWKKLNFWNENYMANFKPISNTLEMDFQKWFWFASFGPI
jgi:hypothetical protein